MLSKLLSKVLKEALEQKGILEKLDNKQLELLGKPPNIDKDGNLIELPKLPDIDNLEKLLRLHSHIFTNK